jgi:hypothetical protein
MVTEAQMSRIKRHAFSIYPSVEEQQCETQPMRNKGCMLSRLEEKALKPARFCIAIHKDDQKITGTFPGKRKINDTPEGYLGCTALRREQCDMIAESRNSRTKRGSHC